MRLELWWNYGGMMVERTNPLPYIKATFDDIRGPNMNFLMQSIEEIEDSLCLQCHKTASSIVIIIS